MSSTERILQDYPDGFPRLVRLTLEGFNEVWNQDERRGAPPIELEPGRKPVDSIWLFMNRGLAPEDVIRCASSAMRRDTVSWDGKWLYFCASCWNMVRRLEEPTPAPWRSATVAGA